jgi:hypothetical protein
MRTVLQAKQKICFKMYSIFLNLKFSVQNYAFYGLILQQSIKRL